MKNVTVKTVEQIEAYSGPGAIPGIRFRTAGRALGVTAWGMNILELDSECTGYPEHDHAGDGQEEVYLVLRGSIVLEVNGEERQLSQGTLVRVPPEIRRKFVTRGQEATLLAIGATPGKAYAPRG